MAEEKRDDVETASVVPSDGDYIKHPLQNSWNWWFFKNDKHREWRSNLKQITVFSTVEDFWALHNHIQPVSNLPPGCDYMIFKNGIEPTWEDAANRQGGRLLIITTKSTRVDKLDSFWLETLLLLVGEGFGDDADAVNGAVVQVRAKQDKLALWTKTADLEQNGRIERKLRESLKLPGNITVSYEAHMESLKTVAPRKPGVAGSR